MPIMVANIAAPTPVELVAAVSVVMALTLAAARRWSEPPAAREPKVVPGGATAGDTTTAPLLIFALVRLPWRSASIQFTRVYSRPSVFGPVRLSWSDLG